MPILVAFTIPAVGVIGAGVDTARAYMAKSQLQAGVDAAALAGARAFAITDSSVRSRSKQAEAYFYGNFPLGYLQVKNLKLTPDFRVVEGVNVTTITAQIELPMTFMKVFGLKKQDITAVARAELQPRPLEVMVVLDDTGSMRTNLPKDSNGVVKTRMTATKDAAKSFVDILYQGAETRSELALGFVMYDITVNVGHLLTAWNSNSVRQVHGFNDSIAAGMGAWPTNKLGWKGCILADDTVKDVNTTWSYQENGAWDIVRSLPGEGSHPPVSPYFIPPMYVPNIASGDKTNTAALRADPSSAYYKVSSVEPGFNLYQLDGTQLEKLVNTNSSPNNLYRRYIYQYFIALNDTAGNMSNDVITRTDGTFYNPATDSWNFKTGAGTAFRINYSKIPNLSLWKPATDYVINPSGGSVDNSSKFRTEPPTPNWQCPEEAVPVAYGKTKSYWKDTVIGQKNGAIFPANGTLHHAGLLWGYRLLVRDDVFKRTNPTNEAPKRALVFMTDGETALGAAQNGYTDRTFTFYGNYADAPISASAGSLTTQSERRFSKTCAALQAEPNPPAVYIIALTTTDSDTLAMFERCAPGKVYRTSDTATLKAAFDDIATELVDLHLTQ